MSVCLSHAKDNAAIAHDVQDAGLGDFHLELAIAFIDLECHAI